MKLDFGDTSTKTSTKREVIHSPIARTLLLLIVAVVLILLALSFLSSLVFSTNSDAVYAYALFSSKGDTPAASPLTIVWVSEKKKEIAMVKLPDQLEFIAPSIGAYPVASIHRAYTQASVEDQTIRTELSIFLRTRVQAFFAAPQTLSTSKRGLWLFVFNSCFLAREQSLQMKECLKLLRIASLPSYTLRIVPFPSSLLESNNAIGLQSLRREAYRTWLSDRFSDSFGFSGQTLTIVNASGISGLAKEASGIFKDLGFSVLSITDAATIEEKGMLMVNSQRVADTNLLQFLATFFHVDLEQDPTKMSGYRTQLVVVLGKGQVTFFTQLR